MVHQKNQFLLIGSFYSPNLYFMIFYNLSSTDPYFSHFELAAQGNTEIMDVGPKEEAPDAFILQEATRQGARFSHAVGYL